MKCTSYYITIIQTVKKKTILYITDLQNILQIHLRIISSIRSIHISIKNTDCRRRKAACNPCYEIISSPSYGYSYQFISHSAFTLGSVELRIINSPSKQIIILADWSLLTRRIKSSNACAPISSFGI